MPSNIVILFHELSLISLFSRILYFHCVLFHCVGNHVFIKKEINVLSYERPDYDICVGPLLIYWPFKYINKKIISLQSKIDHYTKFWTLLKLYNWVQKYLCHVSCKSPLCFRTRMSDSHSDLITYRFINKGTTIKIIPIKDSEANISTVMEFIGLNYINNVSNPSSSNHSIITVKFS